MNDRIDTVFDYDTSNDIADILIDEINNIIQRSSFCPVGPGIGLEIFSGLYICLYYMFAI